MSKTTTIELTKEYFDGQQYPCEYSTCYYPPGTHMRVMYNADEDVWEVQVRRNNNGEGYYYDTKATVTTISEYEGAYRQYRYVTCKNSEKNRAR